MLTIQKKIDLQGFKREFKKDLSGYGNDGIKLLYDEICTLSILGVTYDYVLNYINYSVNHLSVADVVDEFYYDLDGIDWGYLEDETTINIIEQYLKDNSYYIGKYKNNGITHFIYEL